ncbi:glycosyltransferase [Protaetiibacter sp. SSC-01]|uniref:glycosyltransferase n=1 Tax=Protaetiibacter sp. SSC-01 TaxID=2759943 RepID=UPI001656F2CA|nr:glycosyltransferase [Protaetiibacter sp. SSC-01]QNO37051.1 glycosyltransferase [Protaetiibacter sp. SSC-01]
MADSPATSTPVLSDVFVSVVAVLDPTLRGGGDFVRRVHAELSTRYANYEVILVDNGAEPGELVQLRELLATVPCIRILRLSRPTTIDTAIFAGIESAVGDYVVVMSPAHDPVETIPEIVKLGREGNDIIQGVSTLPIDSNFIGRMGRRLFYWYNRRYLGVDIPLQATYLTGLTRRAVNSLTASQRSHRYLRHLIRFIGFRLTEYSYTPIEGPSRRRTFKAGYMEAIEMVSSYSTHPLRVVTIVGVLGGLFNLLYAVYVIVVRLVADRVAEGWTTTSLQLSLMFFVISVIIAVQAEYLGRILTETRREPSYFVMEELESETLIADLERRNVSN